jgi:peptide/nickel transport system substrate-binding protein
MQAFSTRHRIAGGLGVITLALAACGSSSTSSPSAANSGAPTATPTAPITPGGTLNIGLTQEPTSFLADGWVDSMTFGINAVAPAREPLVQLRSNDETANAKTLADFYQPWLATEIPTAANGDVKTSGCPNTAAKMCVTWKLRSDVTWQDGTKFTSHDVCSTLNFAWLKYGLTGKTNPTGILSTSGFDQTIDCKEDTANQATVDFKSVYAPYLNILSGGQQGILPSKQLDAALNANSDLEKTNQTVDLTAGTNNPAAFKGTETFDHIIVGTGPYVLQNYTPTKSITYVRNNNYWNKQHQPSLDKIVFVIVGDVQAQLTAVKAGQLDMGLDYRLAFLNQLNTVASGGKVAVETIPESGAERIDVNTCASTATKGLCGTDAKVPVCCLDDIKFRKAMLEAINRQSIVDNIAAGKTVIPQDSFLYLGAEYIKASASDNPTTAYSVTQAQADLDAAGYKLSPSCHGGQGRAAPNGKCIDLDFVTTSGNPARSQAQVAIQQDLQKIGIFTNISTVKAGKLFGTFSDGGTLYTHAFDMAMYTNTLGGPGEIDTFYPGYHGDCGGTCTSSVQIPSKANSGQGQDDTGENNPTVDKDFDQARLSLDLTVRAAAYKDAEIQLAKDLPELPLYQQVTVNSYTTKLQGLQRNDIVWLFNSYDWNCTGGNCQA